MQSPVLFTVNFRRCLLFILFLLLVQLSVLPVRADYYTFEKGGHNNYAVPQEINNPQYFQYVYGILNRGEGIVDYYELKTADTIADFHIELMVQDKPGRRDFHPNLILVEQHAARMIGKVPFDFPLTARGRVYEWRIGSEAKRVDETIWENLLVGHSLVRDLVPPRLVIAVFDPEHKGGRYVLRLGAIEPVETLSYKLGQLSALLRVKFDLY
ncbi:TPA: hypothetical protein DIV55_05890 [Patescibacteria group bacterium]|uniref:Uncharacterized protein n=1 Tax=Candidatus Gottesmanbacteria bacterium GW2011_GWA1_43_11 TaxID=1618436 RepID=A0A0G1FFE3_9BACT|nr:MAG: hypothetical protein UV59_C0006G0029 [Candidatus Gottesmanbacteria bacterium GW2011_GWA1_43_11]HCS79239.1 hypothetical protein [Patescibacteria group bacterium]